MPKKENTEAPAVQSCLHLANGKKAADGIKKYTPPKKKKSQPQRDERGRFLAGNSVALKWTEDKALEIAEGLLAWMFEKESNFLMKDFLLQRGLYADIVAEMSRKYPRFADYITRAKEIEAHRIQKFAMGNQLNSGMAQWVLAVHHKQFAVQKQEVKSTVTVAPPPQIVFGDDES